MKRPPVASLPDRTDHPIYRDAFRDIYNRMASPKADIQRDALLDLRALADNDFWVFVSQVASFGKYCCQDPDADHYGKPWATHPWVFDLCREAQEDIEKRISDKWYNLARYHFKTEILNKLKSIWELLSDDETEHTIAILTYKVDQTGEKMFLGMRDELRGNDLMINLYPERLSHKVSDYPLWTNTALTVKRRPGPSEPSISIHSILTQPTSGHYTRLVVDDPETRECVRSPATARDVEDAMRDSTALATDDSLTTWIGTIWLSRGPWMNLWHSGFFTQRRKGPAIVKGQPVLRSAKMLEMWRRKYGPYKYSAQLLCEPIPEGDQALMDEWLALRFGGQPPHHEEAKGKYGHIIVDFADGRKNPSGRDGDYMAIWVLGYGHDRRVVALDLHRELFGLLEMSDLIFRLVREWEPHFRSLTVDVEKFGASSHIDHLRDRMERDKQRFRLRALPYSGVPKLSRIELLIQPLEQGKIVFPEAGFGHGSRNDRRDTMDQFLEDEYRLFTRLGTGLPTDDMLDGLAWPWQPETRGMYRFPEREKQDTIGWVNPVAEASEMSRLPAWELM